MDFMKTSRLVKINAKPEPIEVDLRRTAVIVVDMQNAFVSKGGMFDILGEDISGAEGVIENNRRITQAARKTACKVIYLKMSYDPDYSNSGGPESPHWHKELGLVTMRKRSRILG